MHYKILKAMSFCFFLEIVIFIVLIIPVSNIYTKYIEGYAYDDLEQGARISLINFIISIGLSVAIFHYFKYKKIISEKIFYLLFSNIFFTLLLVYIFIKT